MSRPTLQRPWAVVLAAGEGTRLSELTSDHDGTRVPKQFCSLYGTTTLLQDAICRARGFAVPTRISMIVAKQHHRWWGNRLLSAPDVDVIVQPANRGTAFGVLLAALAIAARDPLARLVFLPSDHFVPDELALASALTAVAHTSMRSGELVLLGIEPSEPDSELGYIVPATSKGADDPRSVARFVEKPSRPDAAALIAGGALWNSFIFSAGAATIIELMRSRHPELVDDLETATARGAGALASLYDRLPTIDLSRDILAGAEQRLRVVRAAPCGWSDLGTPRRVAECVRRLPKAVAYVTDIAGSNFINLGAAVGRLRLAC